MLHAKFDPDWLEWAWHRIHQIVNFSPNSCKSTDYRLTMVTVCGTDQTKIGNGIPQMCYCRLFLSISFSLFFSASLSYFINPLLSFHLLPSPFHFTDLPFLPVSLLSYLSFSSHYLFFVTSFLTFSLPFYLLFSLFFLPPTAPPIL